MEKAGKVEEKGDALLMGDNLKLKGSCRQIVVGKRDGNSTPSPSWKFGLIQPDGTLIQDTSAPLLSARKLGANLWEMQGQVNHMDMAMVDGSNAIMGSRRDKTISPIQKFDVENPSDQTTSCTNLRGQVAALPTRHDRRNIKKVEQKQEPASSSTYCSSMEMPPDKLAISTSSSLVVESNFGESNHDNLRTSTELLKVLNRIWSLEEKHALDMSLVKMLQRELDHSQGQIQELLQEKKRDRKEISDLMKQITGYKISRKEEQDRIRDAVKLVEDRVEDELKLRRNSEKLHHKLAKRMSEMKSSLTNALKDLEHERKTRMLLEDLCDEFAKGIRDYEKQVRLLKHKCCEDQIGNESSHGLVLQMSEAWLDERTQIKLTQSHNVTEEQSALDKLGLEIEAFLQAKQSDDSSESNAKNPFEINNVLAHSLESFHFKEPASAPWKDIDEGESIGYSNRCSQLFRGMSLNQGYEFIKKLGEITPDGHRKAKTSSKRGSDSSYSHMQIEEHDAVGRGHHLVNETNNPRMARKGESMMQRSPREGWSTITDVNADLQDMRPPCLTFDDKNATPLKNAEPHSTILSPSGPGTGRKWPSDASLADPGIFEASSVRSKTIKPTTLKEKLIEARLEGQQHSSQAVQRVLTHDM